MNTISISIATATIALNCIASAENVDETAGASPATNAAVQMAFKPSGLSAVLAGQVPQRIALGPSKLETIVKEPDGLVAPKYGVLPFGAEGAGDAKPKPLHVLVDDRPDEPLLFIDFNRNGDLTDDPKPEWGKVVRDSGAGRQVTMLSGGADLELTPGGPRGRVALYRFERDARRPADSADYLFYYRDYFCTGQVNVGDQLFNAILVDDTTRGDFRGNQGQTAAGVRLFVDVNNDNRFDMRAEGFDIARPFNISGTTYEVANMVANGEQFQVVKSSRRAAELGKPIDHAVGSLITPFESVRMDGKTVNFPDDYAGKLVLIDFWATWCGPCMKEMPHLVQAYESYRQQGLEILGVSLDTAKSTAAIDPALARNKMTWPQINDLSIGELYRVTKIPMAFLVDGSTGKIIATGNSLRGEMLRTTIAKALADRATSVR